MPRQAKAVAPAAVLVSGKAVAMSYSVTAMTPTGMISLRTGSVADVRATIAEARKDGAGSVSLARDGKAITEADLASLTSTLVKYA
jgi:hypothetical protein